jgi:hypothetical protein
MKTARDRFRLGAIVLATLAGLIVGLMLAQCGTRDHETGSRVAWPAPESLGLHPSKK